MKSAYFATLIGLLFFTAILKAQPAGWTSITGEHYKISFPQQPEVSNSIDSLAFGGMELSQYMVERATNEGTGSALYAFEVSKFMTANLESVTKEAIDFLYDFQSANLIEGMQGTLISSSDIKLGTYDGRSMRVSVGEGLLILNAQMVLVKNVFLMAYVVSPTEDEYLPSVKAFLNSLEIF